MIQLKTKDPSTKTRHFPLMSLFLEESERWTRNARAMGACEECYRIPEKDSRCKDIYGKSIDYLTRGDDGFVCQSCICDGVKCTDCGVSEKLLRTICDQYPGFTKEEGTSPPIHRCQECHLSNEDYLAAAMDILELEAVIDAITPERW